MYSAIAMMYASHVFEGKRKIDSVPTSVRDQVEEILASTKKQEENK